MRRSLIQPAASIADLRRMFTGSDVGVVFDPLTSAAYSNVNGTTPVVVGGQVALRMDVARGQMELGPELITNGTFDTDTINWQSVNSAILSVEAGKLKTLANGVINPTATQTITTVVGAVYRVSAYLEPGLVSGQLRVGTTAGSFENLIASAVGDTGTVTAYFKATATTTYISHKINSGVSTTNYSYFDNCSVKRVLGTHASQATSANQPILRQTASGKQWLEADANDALTLTFASAPGAMHVGRATATGVEFASETWGTSVNTLQPGAYNALVVARSRPYTAHEETQIRRYWARQRPTDIPSFMPITPTAWFDVSDLSTLFSNAAMTTAAVLNGRVRAMQDKSGRGYHAIAPSDDGSPFLRQDAQGLYYLEFDGSDDTMVFQTPIPFSGDNGINVIAAVNTQRVISDYRLFLQRSSSNSVHTFGAYLGGPSSGANKPFLYNNGHKATASAAITAKAVIGWFLNLTTAPSTATATTRVNRATVNEVFTRTAVTSETLTSITRPSLQQAAMDLYGFVIYAGVRLPDATIESIEDYLAEKVGVTLP